MKKIEALEYNTLLWFLIRASFVEATAGLLISLVHQDAWISVVIGSLLGIIPFLLYNYLKNKYPDKTIIQINKQLFGKLGTFLNIITIIGIFIFGLTSFWTLIQFINSQFLYKTSNWIISITLMIPIFYAASQDIRTISKVSLFMFYITIVFITFIIFGLYGEIEIDNLKPILENKMSNIFYGAFVFIAFNILPIYILMIIPKSKITNNKKKSLFYIISTLTLLNAIFMTITIFGIDLAYLYEYPTFHLLKRVNILDIIDRVESILTLEWILALFIQIVMSIYFTYIAIKQTFKTKEKTNKYLTPFICLLITILNNFIFKTHGTENLFFQNYLTYILYFVCLIIPLLDFFKSLKNM
jgi:spore germination protein KB